MENRRYHVAHSVSCDVPAAGVYDLVRDSAKWPELLAPCEKVTILEQDPDFERIEIQARVGTESMSWQSYRRFLPEFYGIDTTIIQPMKLVKEMTTTWRVVELNTQQSILLLEHSYSLDDDVTGQVAGVTTRPQAAEYIARAIDANSATELGNLRDAAAWLAGALAGRDDHLRHSIVCEAPAETVYGLIRSTANWPRVIDACVSAGPVAGGAAPGDEADGESGEMVRIEALQNGHLVAWETQRRYYDGIHRIDYTLPVPMPFLESMSGQWRVIPLGADRCLLTVDRRWRLLADVTGIRDGVHTVAEAAAVVRSFVDGNATAEMEAFRAFAEDKTDALTSVTTRLPVAASPERVYRRLADVAGWPGVLPHCESLEVRYDDGRYQEFVMRVETAAGAEAFRSMRVCDAETLTISYFQPEPPGTLRQHRGSWQVRRAAGGCEVVARHTALLNTDACAAAFGTADLQEQKARVRDLLDRNSTMTVEAIGGLLAGGTGGA